MRICVITPVQAGEDPDHEATRQSLLALCRPGTEVEHIYPEGVPPSIQSEYEDALATPATVKAAIEAEEAGFDAVVINCTADTGLHPCREMLTIPVVAPSEAALHMAAQISHHFSVLTFLEQVNHRFIQMARTYGFSHKLASVRAIDIPVLELDDDEERLLKRLFEMGLRCVREDNAHALILGCTAFEVISDPLKKEFEKAGVAVQLVRPLAVAMSLAENLVHLKQQHSKLSYPIVKA